jgi:hypothetical protein
MDDVFVSVVAGLITLVLGFIGGIAMQEWFNNNSFSDRKELGLIITFMVLSGTIIFIIMNLILEG